MITCARQIRNAVRFHPFARKPLTDKQHDRETYILESARMVFTRFGFETISLPEFSLGLRLSTAQFRWHYPDLEHLLSAILFAHLKFILDDISNSVYRDDEDRQQAVRAVYFAATRDGHGRFTDMHRLFLKNLERLPEDEADTINMNYGTLSVAVGGYRHGWEAIELLNSENLTLTDIENAMADLNSAPPEPVPPPEFVQSPPDPAFVPHQLPRQIRRKIDAIKRKRERQQNK